MKTFRGRGPHSRQKDQSVQSSEAELGVFQESLGGPWGWSECEQGEKGRREKGNRDQRGQIL